MLFCFFAHLLFHFDFISSSTLGMLRTLDKNGYHREMHTILMMPEDMLPDVKVDTHPHCQVMVNDTFPAGAYVDPFQLSSLKAFDGPDYLLLDHVDVEQLEYQAAGFNIYIFGNLTRMNRGWQFQYVLPLHIRYHAVSNTGYTTVVFENPQVFLKCDDRENFKIPKGPEEEKVLYAPCDSRNSAKCKWKHMQLESSPRYQVLEVPTGTGGDYLVVLLGTLLATLSGCGILGYKVLAQHPKLKAA